MKTIYAANWNERILVKDMARFGYRLTAIKYGNSWGWNFYVFTIDR